LKYGKNDQRVTLEPLMRKHKTGSAKHGGIVQIAHQRYANMISGVYPHKTINFALP